ncbi:hypothetical protein FRC02_006174 [Tulasnella sp. 418]|nr:hypothetical protein FRC02_006174 [Tulasnella sp. 418]
MHALWHLFGCVRHLDKAGIRHRDVSSGNTGWNIRDTPTGKRFVALLYDFDLAKYIGHNQEQSSPCRTGTTPFMAIDLLHDPKCDHFLRFDFESLFWLGVYWSLGYNDQGEKVTNPVDLEEWSKRDFKEVARLKALYLTFVIVPARRNPSMFLGIDNLRGAFHHLYNEGTTLVAAAMQAELQNGLQLLSLNDGKAPELLHLTAYDKLEGVVTMWQPEHRIPSPELISIRESRLAE